MHDARSCLAALQLTVTINRLYSETQDRLESALAAVCSDFRPSHYAKVGRHLAGVGRHLTVVRRQPGRHTKWVHAGGYPMCGCRLSYADAAHVADCAGAFVLFWISGKRGWCTACRLQVLEGYMFLGNVQQASTYFYMKPSCCMPTHVWI
jgi:hypothetical protein